jgi:hypothetical protein
MILLECSGTELAEYNEMKRYCGCDSPAESRKRTCEDEERNSAKKTAVPPFLLAGLLFF